jgi:hypothetical protein
MIDAGRNDDRMAAMSLRRSTPAGLLSASLLFSLAGCIERTVQINTEPEGATVLLNDQEVGKSPVKVPFTWYGDYDVVIRKQGYKTIRTHEKITAPWYETPFFDVFAECLMPFTIHDDRALTPYPLEPQETPTRQALMESARDMKARALAQ